MPNLNAMPSTRVSRHSPFIITIDGPGGVGKSTVAKLLAQRLGLMYLDTGATYRALAYAALEHHLNPVIDVEQLTALAHRLPLHLQPTAGGSLRVELEGRDISRAIRTEQVSEAAAQLSQHPSVRQAMVELQRTLANQHGVPRLRSGRHPERSRTGGVVVEGRDTGSVVFPHATQKFFLDAHLTVRARRRQRELAKRYKTPLPLAQVHEQLQFRDGLDLRRRVGPLVKPAGALTIDTTHLTTSKVVTKMLQHIDVVISRDDVRGSRSDRTRERHPQTRRRRRGRRPQP